MFHKKPIASSPLHIKLSFMPLRMPVHRLSLAAHHEPIKAIYGGRRMTRRKIKFYCHIICLKSAVCSGTMCGTSNFHGVLARIARNRLQLIVYSLLITFFSNVVTVKLPFYAVVYIEMLLDIFCNRLIVITYILSRGMRFVELSEMSFLR